MSRREQRALLGVLAVCFTALVGVACGDDDGQAGSSGATGGAGSDGGGSDGGGSDGGGSGATSSGGTASGGTSSGGADSGGAGSGGAGGSGPAGDLNEVIVAACDWEFRCCDSGERTYRLSPFATDAGACASRLIFEMRQSNVIDNPYPSGTAAFDGILGILGYVVDLSRVEVSAEGVQECKEYWEALGCNVEPDPDARCDGPAEPDPCALTNLFRPILQIGDECTFALTENGIYNDVECVAGSTCLDGNHPDNPNDVPTCVKRGVETEPCSEDDDCDFNFFCSSAGTCTEKSGAGETCSFNDPEEPAPGDENIKCKAGLSCNPSTLKCVDSCSLGFTCATNGTDADLACPAGSGCAPLEIAESAIAFRVCTELGNTAASRCNSDGDCVATRYCDGTRCQADKTISAPCAAQNECAAGLHCDVGNTGTCVNNLEALDHCTDDFQCGPASAGCLNQGTDGFACRASRLSNGVECGDNAACVSGRCELVSDVALVATCVPGAAVDDDCDTIPSDGEAQSCGPGLLCFGETGAPGSGTCVAQANPGTSCENPDGDPDNDMCANGVACADQWNLDICTDAAVGKPNGGTGLTCDGA